MRWHKHGKIFDPREFSGRPWMMLYAQAPSAVIYDTFIRVYFSCRPEPTADGQFVSHTGYVDLSREDPTQILNVAQEPILPLGERGTFDEFGIYPTSVVKHNDSYIAYYGGWTRCHSVPFDVAIGRATSNDGIKFSKYGTGPVLGPSPDEPFVLSGPKIRIFNGKWYLWYIAGRRWILSKGRYEPVYKIRMAMSDDGIHWLRYGHDLITEILDGDEAQASPDVHFRDGKYHMYFCYRHGTDYRNHKRGYRIGYASSNDLLNWERNDDLGGLSVSNVGWDSEMVAYPHVCCVDGRTLMFYLGNAVGKHGFGLAELEYKK